ncbi:unnamed protein product, partial [marine sediment metagenome]
SQEIYERYDEYMMYRKAHDKGKIFKKIDKSEV